MPPAYDTHASHLAILRPNAPQDSAAMNAAAASGVIAAANNASSSGALTREWAAALSSALDADVNGAGASPPLQVS